MSEVDDLIRNYQVEVKLPWRQSLSPAERVWFVVYAPRQERQIRLRLGDFESFTHQAGHGWQCIDVSNTFGEWMSQNPYKETYFARPNRARSLLPTFEKDLVVQVRQQIDSLALDADTVLALSGTSALFGLLRLSNLVRAIEDQVPGRLLVFFPGTYTHAQFRLLDARDGWNYRAVPITATKGNLAL